MSCPGPADGGGGGGLAELTGGVLCFVSSLTGMLGQSLV